MSVSAMSKASRKFRVPDELANLYDFANTLDLRCFTHHGVPHPQSDELADADKLQAWLRDRNLASPGTRLPRTGLHSVLQFRQALRDYLQCDGAQRQTNRKVADALNRAMRPFALTVEATRSGMALKSAEQSAAGLSHLVAELYNAETRNQLARLKMCASDECRRVFFDRSKPASRRWCQSTLCGNRNKTRAYRERQRQDG
jgi:predicted RNA-binding Zn ribbon-like protein